MVLGGKGCRAGCPPFQLCQLCATSYPGGLKTGSWQWDSEGDESIDDELWGTGALREGGTSLTLLGGGGVSTLPCSYLA